MYIGTIMQVQSRGNTKNGYAKENKTPVGAVDLKRIITI